MKLICIIYNKTEVVIQIKLLINFTIKRDHRMVRATVSTNFKRDRSKIAL